MTQILADLGVFAVAASRSLRVIAELSMVHTTCLAEPCFLIGLLENAAIQA